MSAHGSRQAELTAALVQGAAQNNRPVLIPGAFEKRVGHPVAASADQHDVRVEDSAREALARRAAAPPIPDRERLEREREGGGAPSERAGARDGPMLTRFWRSARHPTQIAVIWRR